MKTFEKTTTSLPSLALMASLLLPGVSLAKDIQTIHHTSTPPVIDGIVDNSWSAHPWKPLSHHILGEIPKPEDFSGRFKLMWDEEYLYLLAEIQDDVLSDVYPDPLNKYWDDDCLEIFLDPDASGGEHLHSFNAFAYHLALDNNAVDFGDKPGDIILLNEHLSSQWRRASSKPYVINWEVRIALYSDQWASLKEKSRIYPKVNQEIGFMLAYCDADGKGHREHFMGSESIAPDTSGDKNLGYKTADVFSKMRFTLEASQSHTNHE